MDLLRLNFYDDHNSLFPHLRRYFTTTFIQTKSENHISFETKSFNIIDNAINDNIMNYIPRQFSLKTHNGTSQFNTLLLLETSLVISDHIKENPLISQYTIDIDDEMNVLGKMEQLYQGQLVRLEPEEVTIFDNICEKLGLVYLSSFIYPKRYASKNLPEGIILSKYCLTYVFGQKEFQTFTITVGNKDYKCNIYGVLISKVIRDFLSKNQDSHHFVYDCNMDDDEIQPIIDIFNFDTVEITEYNMYSIKELADDFQIIDLSEKVTKIINKYENLSKQIDDQESIIESVENLFYLLNNINESTIETAKEKILDSFWIKTEEDVQELAAVFLQVISRNCLLHRSLCNLLIELDKERKASIHLQKLMPIIIQKLLDSLGESKANCSFVYNLWKRKTITDDQLFVKLFRKFNSLGITTKENLNAWFLNEIITLGIKKGENINKDIIEYYSKIRDIGEPENEIANSIIHDDVDTFQSIVSKSRVDFSKAFIPSSIYDDFLINEDMKYIDYAAAYGAVKCFKYLLLNNARFSQYTFSYAVWGGNTEIIQIVNQKSPKMDNFDFMIAKSAIVKHRNDIFSWILDQSMPTITSSSELINNHLSLCAACGNAHSYFEIIDKRIDIEYNYLDFIQKAACNGFYRLARMIWDVIKSSDDDLNLHFYKYNISYDSFYCSFIEFNNLAIFKLFLEIFKDVDNIKNCLICAIKKDSSKLVKYFFDEHINESFKINKQFVFDLLKTSLDEKSNMTMYLIDKFLLLNPDVFQESFKFHPLLLMASENGNLEIFKKLSNLSLKNLTDCKNTDYTSEFIASALNDYVEICKYIIDTNLFVNFQQFISISSIYGSLSKEIFLLITNNADPETKYFLLNNFMTPVISKKNVELAEFLLETNHKCSHENFIKAVKTKKIKLVDLILKYNNKPSFINKMTIEGTALNVAANNFDIEMIKRLLSIPCIDVNLYGENQLTPFLFSVKNHNFEMADTFLNYFENHNIDEYIWQLNEALKILIINFPQGNNVNILKKILKIDKINVNITHHSTNNTILIASLLSNNLEIAKLLIQDKRTDINKSNYNQLSPLSIAVEKNMDEIVDLLINNPKFDEEESLLDFSFYIAKGKIASQLSKLNSLDVNYYNEESYQTTLKSAVINKDDEKIDAIINHHSFDQIKSQLTKAITLSIIQKDITNFKKLIELKDNDINLIIPSENISLLDFAISKKSAEIALEILDRPNFKTNQNAIQNTFERIIKLSKESFCLTLLKKLVEFDSKNGCFIDFTKLLSNGKSIFTSINYFVNIDQIVQFIIEHGADPNIPDKKGIYPLQHAIQRKLFLYVVALLKSEKVDLNKRIIDRKTGVSKTYLHYAARMYNSDILIQLLKFKEVDVNALDDNDETPLMEACRFKKIKNIEALFQIDELDYLHVNKNGEDALKIVENYVKHKINIKEKTKENYLKTIKNYFLHEKIDSNDDYLIINSDDSDDEEVLEIKLEVFDDVD